MLNNTLFGEGPKETDVKPERKKPERRTKKKDIEMVKLK